MQEEQHTFSPFSTFKPNDFDWSLRVLSQEKARARDMQAGHTDWKGCFMVDNNSLEYSNELWVDLGIL